MDTNPYRHNSGQPAEPDTQAQSPGEAVEPKQSFFQTIWFWIIVGIVIVALVVGGLLLYRTFADKDAELKAAQDAKAQAELAMEQQALQHDFDELNQEFGQFESQRMQITNDSLKMVLEANYEQARLQVEQLQRELNDSRNKSAAEISRLKAEIESLRKLLRHYVEQIDQLQKENAQLRTDLDQTRQENASLQSQVASTTQQNRQQAEVINRASKLNIGSLAFHVYNKKGKSEKHVKKAQKLGVSFTVLKNVTASTGVKDFYIRISTPAGELLGGSGTFTFEGASLPYTAKRQVEYGGEDVVVEVYYDCANNTLTPGDYTVEVFTDGYRVGNRSFTAQ